MNDKKFNLKEFNKNFEEEQKNREIIMNLKEQEKLNELNKIQKIESNILFDIKDTWFNILDDLLEQRFSFDIFMRDNRLLHIGITIIFITFLLFVYYATISELKLNNKDNIYT